MANSQPGAWKYLATQLGASSDLAALVGARIYREAAPESTTANPTTYPLVVCSFSSSRSVRGTGGDRLAAEPLYLVRAIVDNRDQATLAAAANAIDEALKAQGDPLTVTFSGVDYSVSSWWEADYERDEFDQGVRYMSAGATYRLFIQVL